MRLNVIVDTAQKTATAHRIWLQFGAYTQPRAEVLRKCRVVADSLVRVWGAPSNYRGDSQDCDLEWERPPFKASLMALWDDRVGGENCWALSLTLGVHPSARPPEWWQR